MTSKIRNPKLLLLIRVLAILGAGISLYLLTLKLNGTITSVVGCGDGESCANVLGSRWSEVFGIPVSVFSGLLYTGLFALTFAPNRSLLITCALLLVGAVLWFVGLQLFEIRSICTWCMLTHFVGLASALAIFLTARPLRNCQGPVIMATCLMLPLILGQWLGPSPDTHAMNADSPVSEQPVHERGEGRLVMFGKKGFRIGSLPHLGPGDAEHFLVKYFDYTCGSCRDLHNDLDGLLSLYAEELGVVLLPVPLSRQCNPHLPDEVKDHANACALARLCLAAWLAKPEALPRVHDLLFQSGSDPIEETRSRIAGIVGKDALVAAESNPWIEELLSANCAEYEMFVSRSSRMPKLRIKDGKLMSGLVRTSDEFIELIARELELPVR